MESELAKNLRDLRHCIFPDEKSVNEVLDRCIELSEHDNGKDAMLQKLVNALRTADLFDPDYKMISDALAEARKAGFVPDPPTR